MKSFFEKILNIIKNLNIKLIIDLIIVILKKNYSKYPDYVNKFEKSLSDKFDSKYCLSFSSGTAAFYASLKALKLKEKSKILISSITFPSIIEILKRQNFDIYYFNLDKNFQIITENLEKQNFDLIVVTHPFGFYINPQNLKEFCNKSVKIIFDSSHSQGINISNKDHIKHADISFMSLQGKKSISGGEGGVIFTDIEDIYTTMINNHHPSHIKNIKQKIAGGIDDIKLRMHPLAALIGKHDLKSFDDRNQKLKEKIKLVYNHLDEFHIQHPYKKNKNISGFHYGIPFFFKGNLSSKIIKRYNWYNNLSSLNIENINNKCKKNFFEELYFFDLEWIKNKNILEINKKINKIFKNVN